MNASDGTNPNENNSNPSRSNDQRKGKGRQKLRMEKIENEKNLQVTFSKRRAGLFKKASELSTLCGAESALVVFSAGNKAHSYGHPDVETIANRFLNTNVGPTPPANPLLAAHQEASNRQLNQELIYKEGLLERERQRNRELNRTFKPNISKMSYEELNQLQQDVLGFKSTFESRLKDAKRLEGSTNIQQEPNLYRQGGPSVGFTIPGGLDMMSFPNSCDPHWMGNSTSSYPAPFNPNMGSSMFQYPHGASGSSLNAGGSGCANGSNVLILCDYNNSGVEAPHEDRAATTSNIEPEVETQIDVSNKSHSRGSKHNNRRGGRS